MRKKTIETFLFIGFPLFFYPFSVIDPDFGVPGHLWCQNDVIMPQLRLKAISNCSPHSSQTFPKCLSALVCRPLAYSSSLAQLSDSGFGVLGHLWSQNDVINRHHKLLPPSILDIYTVFEHIDMLSIGIQQKPYTVIPTLIGSEFGVLGHLWSQNDIVKSWSMLTATSNCFRFPSSQTHTQCLSTLVCCPQAYGSRLTQLYPRTWLRLWGSGSFVESK